MKTLAEYIALAKAKPGGLDYASTGSGSASHLAGELFNQRAGVEVVHIPYKGGAQALQDVLSGRVAAYFSVPSTAEPHIEAGKLIPLATTGLTRPAFMASVPTVAESGFPGFNATNWYAFVAPGKTPPAILERWNRELVKAMNDPEVKDELLKRGLIPVADHARRARQVHRQRVGRLGKGRSRAQDQRELTCRRVSAAERAGWSGASCRGRALLVDRRARLAHDRAPLLVLAAARTGANCAGVPPTGSAPSRIICASSEGSDAR